MRALLLSTGELFDRAYANVRENHLGQHVPQKTVDRPTRPRDDDAGQQVLPEGS